MADLAQYDLSGDGRFNQPQQQYQPDHAVLQHGRRHPPTFNSAGSFSGLNEGMYNIHFFTTDCAFTEGLIFNPTGSALTTPTTNWASFPFVTVGIDNVPPLVSSCSAPPSSYGGWYNANFSQSCTVTDQYTAGVSGSGFLPLVANSIQGSPSETVTVNTNAASNLVSVGLSPLPPPLRLRRVAILPAIVYQFLLDCTTSTCSHRRSPSQFSALLDPTM